MLNSITIYNFIFTPNNSLAPCNSLSRSSLTSCLTSTTIVVRLFSVTQALYSYLTAKKEDFRVTRARIRNAKTDIGVTLDTEPLRARIFHDRAMQVKMHREASQPIMPVPPHKGLYHHLNPDNRPFPIGHERLQYVTFSFDVFGGIHSCST